MHSYVFLLVFQQGKNFFDNYTYFEDKSKIFKRFIWTYFQPAVVMREVWVFALLPLCLGFWPCQTDIKQATLRTTPAEPHLARDFRHSFLETHDAASLALNWLRMRRRSPISRRNTQRPRFPALSISTSSMWILCISILYARRSLSLYFYISLQYHSIFWAVSHNPHTASQLRVKLSKFSEESKYFQVLD